MKNSSGYGFHSVIVFVIWVIILRKRNSSSCPLKITSSNKYLFIETSLYWRLIRRSLFCVRYTKNCFSRKYWGTKVFCEKVERNTVKLDSILAQSAVMMDFYVFLIKHNSMGLVT